MLDRDGLERDRDQLWAEAVARFKAGASWWLETPELEALATAEQEARFVIDPWEDDVREWVGDRTDVSVAEVLEACDRDRSGASFTGRTDPDREDFEGPSGI